MGKLRKAREGKIIATHGVDYGFKYNETRDGYEIDPETMLVVRRIFDMLAQGESLYGVVTALERQGIKPPGAHNRSGKWDRTFVRKHVIEDDVYKPHAAEELKAARVTCKLDDDKRYGIFWYNRYRTKTIKTTVPDGNGGKKQKRRHKRTELPRSEWIAVPVPDAGIPLEHIEAARAAVKGNRRWPSKAGGREWELSGGIARCGKCGRSITARSTTSRGKPYYYYYCTHAQGKQATCDNSGNVRAEKLETRVAELVSDILSNEDRLISKIDKLIENERGKLRDPEPEMRAWAERIAEIDQKRRRLLDLYLDEDIPKDQLKARQAELEEQRVDAENGLKAAEGRSERLAELERVKADLQRLYRERALQYGLASFTAEQRREIYRQVKLAVYIHGDQSIGVQGELPLSVSYFDKPWYATDIETDDHGMTATLVYSGKSGSLVCENEEWASVHSQSNLQAS